MAFWFLNWHQNLEIWTGPSDEHAYNITIQSAKNFFLERRSFFLILAKSWHITGPEGHVDFPISTKNITFVEDYPVNIYTKFQELKCKSLQTMVAKWRW